MTISGEPNSERQDVAAEAVSERSAHDSTFPLSQWAQRLAPNLDVVTASSPEPNVEAGTVIAVFNSTDDARELMLAWERLESADRSVGFVALGTAHDNDESVPASADPEGVVKDAAGRAATGALIGGALGALVAVAIGFIVGWGSGAIVGIIAAPLFGAVAGAVAVYVLRSGWGEGYEQSYVDPDLTELAVCAIRVGDGDDVDRRLEAVAAARDASAREVLVVDASGEAQAA